MKKFLQMTAMVLVLAIGGFGCNDKKDNDDDMMTLMLLLVAQQQAKASLNASAIAAHPGCAVLNTASTSSKKLTYGTIGGENKANIKATLTSGQKLIITATTASLPSMSSTYGNSIQIFNENACSTGDFTNQPNSGMSIADNTSDFSKIEITATSNISKVFEFSVTEAVNAGATITYQIQ